MRAECFGCKDFVQIDVPAGFRGACNHILRDTNSFLKENSNHHVRLRCEDQTEGEGIRIQIISNEDLLFLTRCEGAWGGGSVAFRNMVLAMAMDYQMKKEEV